MGVQLTHLVRLDTFKSGALKQVLLSHFSTVCKLIEFVTSTIILLDYLVSYFVLATISFRDIQSHVALT